MNGRRAKKLRREVYGDHHHAVRQYGHGVKGNGEGGIIADPIRQRYRKRKKEVKGGEDARN